MSLNNTDQQLKLKTGTTSQITTAVNNLGIEGEPLYTTDTGELYIHNGTLFVKQPTAKATVFNNNEPIAHNDEAIWIGV